MTEARLFQALSDATRLKILALLARGPMNVSGMVARLGYAQPAVSRHLRVLREVDLIHDARHGKEVEYSLNDGRVTDAVGYLEGLLAELASEAGRAQAEAKRPSGTETRRRRSKPVGSRDSSRRARKRGPAGKAVGGGTPTLPEADSASEEADEPEYAVERKRDDGMDDFLL
jgi:DNA-binding transcriptional ArsR family regulator